MSPQAGDVAPDFSLPDQDGVIRSLSGYRGSTVLLYFYPKDDTPGCTAEACAIRDLHDSFLRSGTVVLGVSADSPARHVKFREKYALPFTLLSDADHEVAELYGAWREKKFMGRTYMGTARVSFLVGPDGKILRAYESVKPPTHAAEVLADVAG